MSFCCTYRVVLLMKSRSIVNMIAWGSCTLTHFDRQFLFISGSPKGDVLAPVSHIKLQTPRETKSRGNKCIKETNSDWPA